MSVSYDQWLINLGVDIGLVHRPNTDWVDVGPNGLDAVVYGAMWDGAGGPGDGIPGCFEVDGIDDYLQSPNHAAISYEYTDSVTHGVWVHSPSLSNSSDDWAPVFSKGAGNYELRKSQSYDDTLGWHPGASHGVHDWNLPQDEWVFYVVQHEWAGSDVTLRIYSRHAGDASMVLESDDVETPPSDDIYAQGDTPPPAGDLYFGSRAGSRNWEGKIAGYFSVSSILTTTEMDAGYDAAFVAPSSQEAAAWRGFAPDPVPVYLHLGNEF